MELESALNRLGDEADQAVADPEHRRDLLGRILFGLYNILLLAAAPVVLAILFGKKRCRSGLVQRMGWLPHGLAEECRDGQTIWVHAVSMGEATAVVPLVKALKRRYPQDRIFVSTVTETGRETVLRRLGEEARHVYFPLDFSFSVRRALDTVRPRAFICVETELWPNFLRAVAARGIPAVLVNGRLSTDSFQGYLRLAPFFRRVLSAFSLCSMQTDRDVERIVRLGADPRRVARTGNLKFDQIVVDAASSITSRRAELGIRPHEDIFLAGSTHPGEEDAVLACYARVLKACPGLVLIIAPRHIERADEVTASAKAHGLAVFLRTALGGHQPSEGPRVIVLDTRGELASLYPESTVVFVGGSLVPVGGHSPLEPAACGKTVVFGPHMDHFAEVAEGLVSLGGGRQIANADELPAVMTALLEDRSRLETMGKAAREFVRANQGAVARTEALIAQVLQG